MPARSSTDEGGLAARRRRPTACPRRITIRALIPILAAIAACAGGDAAPLVTRTDSAGVEVVVSGAEDRPMGWSFTERFELGGEDEGPESFYTLNASTLATDQAGRIHVLDFMNQRVVSFDAGGEFIRAVGRKGGGPGEVESPYGLSATPAGGVAVFDYRKMALVRWDSAGALLPERPFPHPPMIAGRHHALTSDGYLVSTGGMVDGERSNRLIAVTGEDTTMLAAAPQPVQNTPVRFESCGGGVNFPPLFTPHVVWDHRNGTTAVASGDEYRIDVWRDGRPVRSIRRPLPVTEATRDLAIAEAGDGFRIDFGQGPCTVPPDEYADARGWTETVPAIHRLALAPDGAIWVERWVPGADPMPIDVFDADGAYQGTLPEGTEFPALLMVDGRVGVVRVDEMDVGRLVVGSSSTVFSGGRDDFASPDGR